MKTTDFDYELPEGFIAQNPIEPRDASRLLVLNRGDGTLRHDHFNNLSAYMRPGDLLVLNETRVLPARLFARKKPSGGRFELLLLKQKTEDTWEVLVGGKGLRPGVDFQVESGPEGTIVLQLSGARRLVEFADPIEGYLPAAGHIPLPPYIHASLTDPERYQTVYARYSGSAAAPTAGLHFTPRLMDSLMENGIRFAAVTLHVGMDTFAPVTEERPQEHKIHSEWCQLTPPVAETINRTRQEGGRIIAVGTTSVRVLESAARQARQGEVVGAYEGSTELFILPGFQFRAVDALITNFHLPKSTLIMLVSAFATREVVLDAYRTAIQHGYRFYSFGDAMLIV